MSDGPEAFVLAPGERMSIELGALAMTVKASADETGTSSRSSKPRSRRTSGRPLRFHHDAAQAFYVLEREYVMFLDDRSVRCPAGSFVAACGTVSESARD
jgi:hypothetical protein